MEAGDKPFVNFESEAQRIRIVVPCDVESDGALPAKNSNDRGVLDFVLVWAPLKEIQAERVVRLTTRF